MRLKTSAIAAAIALTTNAVGLWTPPAEYAQEASLFSYPLHGHRTQGFSATHPAIDIGADIGTPIMAAGAGVVVLAEESEMGYGNWIIIDHGNGLNTRYAHLDAFMVTPGQVVAHGETVGTVGVTGNSTGPHLHFEVRQDTTPLHPDVFLFAHR